MADYHIPRPPPRCWIITCPRREADTTISLASNHTNHTNLTHTKSPLSSQERGLFVWVRLVLPPGVLRRLQDGPLRQHLRQMRAEVR
jgi:hypothetical protein